jgi:peptidoglycan/LPS O-acetylase OafA/YrhL
MEQAKANKPPGGSDVLLSIQALRGIAVMAVILIHIQLYFSNKLRMPDFLPQFNIGAASVDVFFVISGFIMVYASERLFGQPGGMRIYFLRRVARIVPMYWAATTILATYVVVQYGSLAGAGGAEWDYLVASYLFWPYVRPDGWGTPLLGVGWTLNYEVFFYTLFGLCIALSRRKIVLTIGALFCVLIAIRTLYPGIPNPFAYWFNPLIIEFVFGMAVAVAFREGVRLPMWLVWTLVAGGIAVLGWSWSQAHFFDPPSWLRVPVWGLPALAIVGGFALASRPVPRNLFWRVSGFLGDASYLLYLVHTLTLGVPRILLGRFIDPASAPWLYFWLIALVTVVPSLLVYVYVEKPLTAYFQRRIEKRRHPQAAAVATPATS